jgi:anti-sigma factor RsiW
VTSVFDSVRFRFDHRWAPTRMSAYLDGELGRRGRARMERHAELCPECHGVLQSLRSMLDKLQRLPRPGASAHGPDIAAAVRSRLREPSS